MLGEIAAAQNCFPGAKFPLMIGYGTADNTVLAIDRRDDAHANGERLALALISNEPQLRGNVVSTDGSALAVATYDPVSYTYKWWWWLDDFRGDYYSFVYFTPDGNRVLLASVADYAGIKHQTMIFFNAQTGVQVGANAFKRTYN